MSSFVALDVETANSDYASICSIGAARFERGAIVDEFYTLVDPQDYFAAVNVGIHGIDRDKVARAPRFAEALPRLNEFVADSVVVHHTQFDRSAISQAAARAKLPPPSWRWLDSALVTRRTWPHRSRDGYGLAEVCRMIGLSLRPPRRARRRKGRWSRDPRRNAQNRRADARTDHRARACAPFVRQPP